MHTLTTIEGRTVAIQTGPFPADFTYLTVVRADAQHTIEAWSWHATIAVQGPLPKDEAAYDEAGIIDALRSLGIHPRPEGGGAGHQFADPIWFQYLGEPVRTLLVSQRGGRDV